MRSCVVPLLLALAAWPLVARSLAAQQQLGYKLLGSAGIDAGVQSPPGLFIIDRVLRYDAHELRDRQGNTLLVQGLDIRAGGNGIGASLTIPTKREALVSFAIGIPYARIHVSSDRPEASVSDFGFGDLYVQPIKLGWRERGYDVVAAYMVYAPTGHFEPRSGKGTGSGYWTHMLSAGGAVYADSARRYRASALLSYEQNARKRGIDIRRGNMLQVQGGAGAQVLGGLTAGVATYALWQVTPDVGTDIPPALRGQRSRTYGVGPEVDLVVPRWRMRFDLRVEGDFAVTSRPKGRVLSVGASYLAWAPARRPR